MIFCDVCGQQIVNGASTILSIAVQSPSPSTSPNICSYDCASQWILSRKQLDIKNGVTPVSPITSTTTVTLQPVSSTATPSTSNTSLVGVSSA